MVTVNATEKPLATRRDFLKTTGQFAAASALAGVALPHVHAAEDNTIRLALIGCGGRGNGAVANAMSAGGLVLGLLEAFGGGLIGSEFKDVAAFLLLLLLLFVRPRGLFARGVSERV